MVCVYCKGECFSQRFRVGKGWEVSHEKCRPDEERVGLERRQNRANQPMGYVPRKYPLERALREGMGGEV